MLPSIFNDNLFDDFFNFPFTMTKQNIVQRKNFTDIMLTTL